MRLVDIHEAEWFEPSPGKKQVLIFERLGIVAGVSRSIFDGPPWRWEVFATKASGDVRIVGYEDSQESARRWAEMTCLLLHNGNRPPYGRVVPPGSESPFTHLFDQIRDYRTRGY